MGKTDDNEAYTIKLGDKKLHTPNKNLFRVTNETLALAIANEWKTQVNKKVINHQNMHLTTLAYTAIDNPFNESNELVADSILEYLKFDTMRIREADGGEDLANIERKNWDPVVDWFEKRFNVHIPIDYSQITKTIDISDSSLQTIRRNLISNKRWPLISIKYMSSNLKSYILTSTLTEKYLSSEKAVSLSRLETTYQTQKWSKVEWEHDLDEQILQSRVSAGALFYHLSS